MKLFATSGMLAFIALSLANPSFSDQSFESIPVNPGQFVQAPASAHWNFTNVSNFASGVANGSGSWGSSALSGTKYAYIQRNAQISQTVGGLTIGQAYEIRFGMSRRNGSVGGNDPNRIALQVNGATVNTHDTINDGIWRTFRSPMFVATSTSATVRWQGLRNDEDRTSLIDDAQIVVATPRSEILSDGGFETVNFGPSGWSYNPAWVVGSDWQFQNNGNSRGAGIASAGSPWGGSAAAGNQFAFVQRDGILNQELRNLIVGRRYWVTFAHGTRPGGVHQLRVRANGTEILGLTNSPSTWTTRTTASFVATASNMNLSFEGQAGSSDVTSLVDNVQVVPEPAGLLAMAVGSLWFFRRQAKTSK